MALGLISCALCVQRAQAAYLNAALNFAGGVELNSGSVNTASQVLTWLDEDGNLPTVQSGSGSFAGLDGQTATFAFPWSFNTAIAIPAFWTVGGFTFNLIASTIISQMGDGFLAVSGTGTISGNGYATTTGVTWSFTVQDDASNGVFSFSSGSLVPDGGATVALLGLALAGI